MSYHIFYVLVLPLMHRQPNEGVHQKLFVIGVIHLLNAEKFTAFTDSIPLLFKLIKT